VEIFNDRVVLYLAGSPDDGFIVVGRRVLNVDELTPD